MSVIEVRSDDFLDPLFVVKGGDPNDTDPANRCGDGFRVDPDTLEFLGDPFLDPGECANFDISILNGTGGTLTNTRVCISTSSVAVDCIVDGCAFYGTIADGETAFNPEDDRFRIIMGTGDAAQNDIVGFGDLQRNATINVTVLADQIRGSTAPQRFTVNLDLDAVSGFGQEQRTFFEGFESRDSGTCSGTGEICFSDADCPTGESCSGLSGGIDPDEDLRDANDRAAFMRFEAQGRGSTLLVPGPLCPSNVGKVTVGTTVNEDFDNDPTGRPNDWHIHNELAQDETGQNKAHTGTKSLHYGRHLDVDNDGTIDVTTFRVNRQIAFVLQDINFDIEGEFELDFWHIIEFLGYEYWPGYQPSGDSGNDHAIVEVAPDNNFDPDIDEFGAWERVEPFLNPYDATQDQYYTDSGSFDPGDDVNPADPFNRQFTMCFPLNSYMQQGSSRGIDADNCTDGDGDGTFDCGDLENVANPARRGPGFMERSADGAPGVWSHTKFNLARYAGRHVKIRFIVSTIDDVDGFFLSYFETEFGDPGTSPEDLQSDDGWYIDDIQITGTVAEEVSLSIDREIPLTDPPGPRYAGAVCPADAGATDPICVQGLVTAIPSASPSTSFAPGSLITLNGSASQMPVCIGGTILYRWNEGSTALQPFSTNPKVLVSPLASTTYTLDVACSQDLTCAKTDAVTVLVYSGINTGVDVTVTDTGLSWLTPPLPPTLDTGLAAQFGVLRGEFGGAFGPIDADFSDQCSLGDLPGAAPGQENLFSDATLPGAGTGLYYLVSIDTAIGPSLGEGSAGKRAGPASPPSCP